MLKEGRDDEISAFNKMQTSLQDALIACKSIKDKTSNNMEQILKGYDSLFNQISGGQLSIKKNVPETRVMGKVLYKGQEMNKKDRKKDPLFAHEPSLHDPIQSGLGNCYMISALSSIVSVEPQLIKDCMKDNGDGTITVRLYRPGITMKGDNISYDSRPVYYRVPKQTLGTHGGANALWVNAMEYAYYGFRKDYDIRRQALDDIIGKIPNAQARSLAAKRDELSDKAKRRLLKKFPQKEHDLYLISMWAGINAIEDFIKTQPYAKQYEDLLKNKQQDDNSEIDISRISGGTVNEVFTALSGKVFKETNTRLGTDIMEMNNLRYVYDDMMENYFTDKNAIQYKSLALQTKFDEAKALISKGNALQNEETSIKDKEKKTPADEKRLDEIKAEKEAVKKALSEKNITKSVYNKLKIELTAEQNAETIARKIIRKYISGFDCNNLNSMSDTTDMAKVQYLGYMTRDQLKGLVTQAANQYNGEEIMNNMLTSFTDQDEEKQLYNQMVRDKLEPKRRIKEAMDLIFNQFITNAEKNTLLNYERFSGQYSKRGMEVFNEINEAINARKAITAATYDFSDKNADIEEGGEYVFSGIASTAIPSSGQKPST